MCVSEKYSGRECMYVRERERDGGCVCVCWRERGGILSLLILEMT